MTDFTPARGITSSHAQTIFSALRRKPPAPPGMHRERWGTEDNDFFDVDILPGKTLDAPTVVLLHGLEGSSGSGYIRQLLQLMSKVGWWAYAINFRGCSGEPNRQARSYCSGDTTDFADTLSRLRSRGHRGRIFAIGYSLGGNVLLKHLGDTRDPLVDAAVAISVPFELASCAKLIDAGTGLGRIYLHNFMLPLKRKALQKAQLFPGSIDADAARAAKTIWAFDDAVTSRLYGLKDAAAYYAWASSGTRMGNITTPSLIITARDDAFAPASLLPQQARDNPALTIVETEHGGHCGFWAGTALKPDWWAERAAIDWLAAKI